EERRLVENERGLKLSAQQYMRYNASLETVEILEAYTQKPDDRKIMVQPDQIRTQQEVRSFNAPMFQDLLYQVIIFPEVAVGDRLYWKLVRRRHTPLFPGHFLDATHPQDVHYGAFLLVYDMPESMRLNVDNVGFRQLPARAVEGKTRYEWAYIPKPRPRAESGTVAYADYGDHLYVSTFQSHAEFAQAYEARSVMQSGVTPAIEALVTQLLQHVESPMDKVRVLYDWVRHNVRYVAVYVGPGGVVPHSAEAVLHHRYGDCKDHVVLLEALLAAAGIESTPALTRVGTAYTLPSVPVFGVLNHVITYIPSLNLYLDSTAASVAFGFLPREMLDKPVILTKSGQTGHTPATQPHKVETAITIQMAEDGAATF